MLSMMDSRWSLGRRLTALSTLFIAPIGLMIYLIVADARTQAGFTDKERSGVEYLNQLWPLVSDATKGRMTDASRIADVRAKYDEAFEAADAAKAFVASKTLEDRIDNGTGLMSAVADGSNLTLDPDLDSFYTMDVLVNNIPSLINAATDIRSELASKTRSHDKLTISVNQLNSDAAAIERKVGLAIKNNASGDTGRALSEKARALASATKKAAADISVAMSGKKPFDAAPTIDAMIQSSEDLWQATSAELDRLLKARNTKLYRSLMIEMAAVLAALLAAGALSTRISRGLTHRFNGMVQAMNRLSAGDLKVEIPCQADTNETGLMAKALVVFRKQLSERARLESEAAEVHRLNEQKLRETEDAFTAASKDQAVVLESLGTMLSRLAQGDLTARLDIAVAPQYAQLKADFNAAMSSLEQTLSVVSQTTEGIQVGGSEIAQASSDLARRTEQQAANLEETAAALEQITVTVENTAKGTRRASEAAASARDEAKTSGDVMHQAVSAMNDIQQSSNKIAQIITVIDEIAFQTNLLALNAGVEAARAGDAGRGFAVVASEVRALAQRAAGAAKEIKTLIMESTTQVESGVELVAKTGAALERIVTKVTQIDALVSEFSSSADQQAMGLKELNTAVGELDHVTQQNAAMVEQATAASASLQLKTTELADRIAAFKVSGSRSFAAEVRAHPTPVAHTKPQARAVQKRVVGGSPVSTTDDEGWQQF